MDPDMVRQQQEAETLSKGGASLPDEALAHAAPPTDRGFGADQGAGWIFDREARPKMPDEKPVTPAWRDAAAAETAARRQPQEALPTLPVLALSAKSALSAFLGGLTGHAGGLAAAGAAGLPPDQTLVAAGALSLAAAICLAALSLARRMQSFRAAFGAAWPGALICAGVTIVASLRAPQLAGLDPWTWGGVALAAAGGIGLAWGLTYMRIRSWLTSR
jgi:hypothetical protein